MIQPMMRREIQLEKQKLAYCESAGRGPVILLIHGNSCSGQAYRAQLEGELGQHYRLIAFDLPGHGDSDPMPRFEDYSMAGYARVLNQAVKALSLHNPILVGWSLGGHIALEMSLDSPGLKGLVIFGTPPLGFPPDMENAFLPVGEVGVGMQGEVSEEDARTYARSFFGDSFLDNSRSPGGDHSEPLPILNEITLSILNTDPDARLGLGQNLGPDTYHDEVVLISALEVPLAIFHGVEEKLVNLDYIRGLSMPTLWRKQVQLIEDAGHAPQIENSQAFNSLLSEFAEGVL